MVDQQRRLRILELVRLEDPTGVSGTGVVAYGVEFPDGHIVLRWATEVNSTVLYDSEEDLIFIHGHGGATQLRVRTELLLTDQGGHSLYDQENPS